MDRSLDEIINERPVSVSESALAENKTDITHREERHEDVVHAVAVDEVVRLGTMTARLETASERCDIDVHGQITSNSIDALQVLTPAPSSDSRRPLVAYERRLTRHGR